jgi:hypothetical protein
MTQQLAPDTVRSTPVRRRRPRVGHIQFLNCLPLFWGLARTDVTTFTAQHGWRLDYLSSYDELRATILSAHGMTNTRLAIGESIALLSKSDSL